MFGVANAGMDFPDMEGIIPYLMSDQMNNMIIACPSVEEIKIGVFNLSSGSFLGPGGFGGFIFQKNWEIVKNDVINVVLQSYNQGWIMHDYNVSFIVLITKYRDLITLDRFGPIALTNFKFKIITKILADMMVV